MLSDKQLVLLLLLLSAALTILKPLETNDASPLPVVDIDDDDDVVVAAAAAAPIISSC